MFIKAKPIFLKGLQKEMNVTGAFVCRLPACSGPVRLRIAAATRYRAVLNGEFLAAGPARAAHGHARVDEIMLHLPQGGTLRIDVASYYVRSYDGVKHPGFLTAEAVAGEQVLAATGFDFEAFRDMGRVQKVMRFSLQRHFSEVYRGTDMLEKYEAECVPEDMIYIPREAPMPCTDLMDAPVIAGEGSFVRGKTYHRDPWYIRRIPEHTEGYASGEVEAAPYRDYYTFVYTPDGQTPRASETAEVGEGRYVMYDFGKVNTGFIRAEIEALEDTELIISHEDYCAQPYVDTARLNGQYMHIISYTLKAGKHVIENFDPIELRYAQFTVVRGSIRLNRVGMRLYIYPEVENARLDSGDERLDSIYEAAVSTFRQNSLDIFMDCPCRERAGWLCDSYFTAQTEYMLTGDNRLERTFLDNFVRASGRIEGLPEGMLPMCYPADFTGSFIPQWAMWYVMELEQALVRCPSMDRETFRPLCEKMLAFFRQYINADGLIENLPGWNFVEWSKCNEWTGGVSYPTNFLYSRVLKALGSIYSDAALIEEGEKIRRTAVEQSFDGEFFTDNALRNEKGELVRTGNTSETCQYYAIRLAGIDPDAPEYERLKHAFEHIFGPDHSRYGELGRDIEPSNAFIGIYLRLECLLERGLYEKAIGEIRGFFGGMADLTGTLWEHDNIESGSLNHGFASFAAVALKKALVGMAERNND